MSLRKTILRNSASRFASFGVDVAVALAITPFLIRMLGTSTYGLFVLVASFIGFFGLTDLGLRSAVGRFIALHKARNNVEQMNRVIVTTLHLFAVVMAVIVVATLVSSVLFSRVFNVNPDQVDLAWKLVLIVGATLAISLPLDVFDGILIGHARYDWLNGLEICSALSRAGAAVVLLSTGHGVVALAWANLIVKLVAGAAKVVLSYRLFPELRLSFGVWHRETARVLYGFSIWNFIMILRAHFGVQADNLIIGWALDPESVAVYSIAGRLFQYAMAAGVTFTSVLLPHAAEFHAQDDLVRQKRLLLQSTKATLFYAFFLVFVFAIFGEKLITFWVGEAFRESWLILLILMPPLLGLLSQSSMRAVLMGMARHKWVAIIHVTDLVVSLILAVILVRHMGLIGPAVAKMVTTTITMLIIVPLYACSVLNIRIAEYLRAAYRPLLIPILLLAAGLLAVKSFWTPGNLLSLGSFIGIAAVVYFGAVYNFHFAAAKLPKPAVP